MLLHLPIAYVALKSGFGAESVFVVAVILTSLAGVARIVMLKRILDFSFKKFLRTSLLRALLVSGVTTIISHNFANWFGETTKLLSLLSFSLVVVCVTLVIIWLLGLEPQERRNTKELLSALLKRY